MKKILFLFVLFVCFYIIETLIVYIITYIVTFGKTFDFNFSNYDFRHIIGLIIIRSIYFIVPQLLLFYLFTKLFELDTIIKWSIANTLFFVIIFFLYLIYLGDFKEFINRPVTYYFLIATFISPIIASRISLIKDLFDKV